MLLDPHLLRTFVAFADTGSLTQAAEVVGRSASAVTSQMQQLEALVGEALLVPAGRRRVLTPAGQDLVGHARRILEVHRAAWLSLSGARKGGSVAIGATQDFAEAGLPDLLALFAGTHPRVRLDLSIGRTAELSEALRAGRLDVLVAARSQAEPDEVTHWQEPAVWLARAGGLVGASLDTVPLALLEAPCGFRSAALAALERVQRPYRLAATSLSLSGLFAAVTAGLAVTLRTRRALRTGVDAAPGHLDLPTVEPLSFAVRLRVGATPAARVLAELMAEHLPDRGT